MEINELSQVVKNIGRFSRTVNDACLCFEKLLTQFKELEDTAHSLETPPELTIKRFLEFLRQLGELELSDALERSNIEKFIPQKNYLKVRAEHFAYTFLLMSREKVTNHLKRFSRNFEEKAKFYLSALA